VHNKLHIYLPTVKAIGYGINRVYDTCSTMKTERLESRSATNYLPDSYREM